MDTSAGFLASPRAAFALCIPLLLLACGGSGGKPAPPPERGDVVRTFRTATATAAQVESLFAPYDADAAKRAVHDVTVHTLVYVTEDQHGALAEASGALIIPVGSSPALMVSIQHGTVTLRTRVASVEPGATPEGVLGLLLASAGYVVSLPDYQGFGASTAPLHPYVHARALASAVIDLLVAAETVGPGLGARLDGRLFLTGYSEGGYATLASHREIEQRYPGRFRLVASAPMAGPFDLSGTVRSVIASPTYPYPAYAAFLLTAYDEAYGWRRLGDIFQNPYAGMVRGLFDGTHDFDAVNRALPTDPSQLLRADFVRGVLDGSEVDVLRAFAENDLLDWTPVAPVRLYHGDADDAVPYQNALTAVQRLSSATNSVELVTVHGGTHATAGLPAILDLLRWLDGR